MLGSTSAAFIRNHHTEYAVTKIQCVSTRWRGRRFSAIAISAIHGQVELKPWAKRASEPFPCMKESKNLISGRFVISVSSTLI